MDYKRKLREAHVQIVQRLSVEPLFVAHARAKDLITSDEKDMLTNLSAPQTATPVGRALYFLAAIERRISHKTWKAFIEVLQKTQHEHIIEILNEEETQDEALTELIEFAKEIHAEVEVEENPNIYKAASRQLCRFVKKKIRPEQLQAETENYLAQGLDKTKVKQPPDSGDKLRDGEEDTTEVTTGRILQAISDLKKVNICLFQVDGSHSYSYPASGISNNTLLLGQTHQGKGGCMSLQPNVEGLEERIVAAARNAYIKNFRDHQVGCLTHIRKKATQDLTRSFVEVDLKLEPADPASLHTSQREEQTDCGVTSGGFFEDNFQDFLKKFMPKDVSTEDNRERIGEDKMFTSDKSPIRSVLLQGEAGVGKTVFVQRWCYQWATRLGIDFLHKQSLILVLEARKMNGSIEDAIKSLFPRGKREEMYNYIEGHEDTCLIIVEALDEYRGPDLSSIEDLVSGNILPLAKVLVTGRTNQINMKEHAFDRVVQLNGLPDEKVTDFCESTLSDFQVNKIPTASKDPQRKYSAQVASKIIKDLLPLEMLKTPLLCLIICFGFTFGQASVFEEGQEEKINRTLLFGLLKDCLQNRCMETCPENDMKKLQHLALWSVLTLEADNISLETLKQFAMNESVLRYGFLVKRCTYSFFDEETSYAFLHQQFLEFMAANALLELPEAQKKSIIVLLCDQLRFGVLGFAVGLMKQREDIEFLLNVFVTQRTKDHTSYIPNMFDCSAYRCDRLSKLRHLLCDHAEECIHQINQGNETVVNILPGLSEEVERLLMHQCPFIVSGLVNFSHSAIGKSTPHMLLNILYELPIMEIRDFDIYSRYLNEPVPLLSENGCILTFIPTIMPMVYQTVVYPNNHHDTIHISVATLPGAVTRLSTYLNTLMKMGIEKVPKQLDLHVGSLPSNTDEMALGMHESLAHLVGEFVKKGLTTLKLFVSQISSFVDIFPAEIKEVHIMLKLTPTANDWRVLLNSLSKSKISFLQILGPHSDISNFLDVLMDIGKCLPMHIISIIYGKTSYKRMVDLLRWSTNVPFTVGFSKLEIHGIKTIKQYLKLLDEGRLETLYQCRLKPGVELENDVTVADSLSGLGNPRLSMVTTASIETCGIYLCLLNCIKECQSIIFAPACTTLDELHNLTSLIIPAFKEKALSSKYGYEVHVCMTNTETWITSMEALKESEKNSSWYQSSDHNFFVKLFFEPTAVSRKHRGYAIFRRSPLKFKDASSCLLLPEDDKAWVNIEYNPINRKAAVLSDNEVGLAAGLNALRTQPLVWSHMTGLATSYIKPTTLFIGFDGRSSYGRRTIAAEENGKELLKTEIEHYIQQGISSLFIWCNEVGDIIVPADMPSVYLSFRIAKDITPGEQLSLIVSMSGKRIRYLDISHSTMSDGEIWFRRYPYGTLCKLRSWVQEAAKRLLTLVKREK